MTGDDTSIDTGAPILILADLQDSVPERLRGRVRNAIRRRHLVGDLLDFAVATPGLVLMSYVASVLECLHPSPARDGDESSAPTDAARSGSEVGDEA